MTDFLDALEQQLVGAAAHATRTHTAPTPAPQSSRVGSRRSRRSRSRWLMILVPALLVLAAGGLALGGVIEIGSPAKPGYSATAAGFGPLVLGSSRLEPVSTPDPSGGPPWGMRVFSTKQGVGCLEVGRLFDGRLGALGEDGAFHDDGQFHEIPTGSSVRFFACSALDANGRIFNNVTVGDEPASGWSGFEACVPATATAPEKSPERGHAIGICPQADERDLYYGLLGPEATSITYTSEGEARTLPTAGPDGAYLIVTDAPSHQLFHGAALGTSDVVPVDGPITEVHYRDGSTCHLTARSWIGGADACTPSLQVPVGYKAVKTPTAAAVAAPVSARVQRGESGEEEILVSFVSPVSITEYRSSYSLQLEESTLHPRAYAPYRVAPAQDVTAGQTVTIPVRALHLHESLPAGLYKGTISLISATGPALFEGPGTVYLRVGSFSVSVP
jgi:hypothetical protein